MQGITTYVHASLYVYSHVKHYYSTGLFSTTGSVYLSEMSPTHLRGRLGVALNLFTAGGLLTGVIIAGLFSMDTKFAHTYGWRLYKKAC